MTLKQRIIAEIEVKMKPDTASSSVAYSWYNYALSDAIAIIERILSEPVTEKEVYNSSIVYNATPKNQNDWHSKALKAVLQAFMGESDKKVND